MFSYENPPTSLELPIVRTSLNYLLALLGFGHRKVWERNKEQETVVPPTTQNLHCRGNCLT